MALTIKYSLQAKENVDTKAIVEKMRQITLDLPFEEVSEIRDLTGDQCNFNLLPKDADGDLRWFLIQASQHIELPWSKLSSVTINPTHAIGFTAWPGDGCEPANFGLCQYQDTVTTKYSAEHDEKFRETIKDGGMTTWRFSYKKWARYCEKNGIRGWARAFCGEEQRTIPTKLPAHFWSSFCKTQYASEESSGGIANFLKCHITLITALDRMAKIPGLKVNFDDEGKYGRSRHSDDWREARVAGRKPKYTWHKGKYSPKELAIEVGEWNEMIAATFGAIKDALPEGLSLESPIANFQNFEVLEFNGRKSRDIKPFLAAMEHIAKKTRVLEPA